MSRLQLLHILLSFFICGCVFITKAEADSSILDQTITELQFLETQIAQVETKSSEVLEQLKKKESELLKEIRRETDYDKRQVLRQSLSACQENRALLERELHSIRLQRSRLQTNIQQIESEIKDLRDKISN